ncbi:DUF2179 domain-containing protein [Paenibacillus chungangensis]|uniref:UPF0316 protein ACFQ2I_17335 n=1 Tax=Paenibacillus chungangensis TaxID=696535 RepID=A0ABW3HUM3_9BACL
MNDVLITIIVILIINSAYMSIFTMRIMLVMKGYRFGASILSVVEVYIYVMGLKIVLDNIDKPLNLLAYCIGWGGGVYVGSKIEELLALGYVSMQIVVDSVSNRVPIILREGGFGVTSWVADGKEGQRLVMQVLAKRSDEKKLFKVIEENAPKAFVISYEAKNLKGGFWTKRL